MSDAPHGDTCDESGEVTAADDVVAVGGGFAPAVEADAQHDPEVDDDGDDDPGVS